MLSWMKSHWFEITYVVVCAGVLAMLAYLQGIS